MKEIVNQAREFDEKLEELRSNVCEPSKLGKSLHTASALNHMEEKVRDLLAAINEINQTMARELADREQKCDSLAEVLKDLDDRLNGT